MHFTTELPVQMLGREVNAPFTKHAKCNAYCLHLSVILSISKEFKHAAPQKLLLYVPLSILHV